MNALCPNLTYTTAEEAYDSFGTRTIATVGTDRRGRTIRVVWTPLPHLLWQRQRYGSGLHLAASVEQWRELHEHQLVNASTPMSPNGLFLDLESQHTHFRPGDRVGIPDVPAGSVNERGVLAGFSRPRGYAVVLLDEGVETTAHPEYLRADPR